MLGFAIFIYVAIGFGVYIGCVDGPYGRSKATYVVAAIIWPPIVGIILVGIADKLDADPE